LIDHTVQAATVGAAGQAATAGLVSAKVAALTEGVVRAMWTTKLKVLAVLLGVALLGGGGALLTARTWGQEPGQGKNADKPRSAGKDDAKAKPAGDAKKEKERLQGTWTVVTIAKEENSEHDAEDSQMVISGDEFTMKQGDQVLAKGKFKLDPSKSPKAIDLEIAESSKEGDNGKTALGIYALDGDSLKICLVPPGETDRPQKFTAAAEKRIVFTLKREKNESKADEKRTTDKDKLQGSWAIVSVEQQGTEVPEEEVKEKNAEMVFSGDNVTVPTKGGSKEAEFKLNPCKKPKEIDLAVEGKTLMGIYLLEGDTLKLCVQKDADGERPTKFATEGTMNIQFGLKRKK
jgi:uncharacterized protein (TIGR03067 family)